MKRTILIMTFILAGFVAFAQNNEEKVRIYPNPATETINITIQNVELKSPTVAIHSIIGNKMNVDVDNLQTGFYRAEISDLPPGYYLVVVKDQETQFNRTYKFLKR